MHQLQAHGMNKPLLLLIGAGYLVSCNKEASNPVNNWTWFGTQNSTVYNYVLINANQVVNNGDSEELHIGVSAAFIDSNNHQVTVVRTLSVNNQIIQPGEDSTYNYNFTPGQTNKGFEVFGSQVMVTIRGIADADTVTSSVYVPKQLTQTILNYPDTISEIRGLPLQWAPDSENTWGNVTIQLFYYSGMSRKFSATLPENIPIVNITVPDNGNYELNKSDLASFPAGAFIGITIARGTQNEAILPLSMKKVYFFSSASVSTSPIQLKH
jgi:hypothetical protein